MGGWNEFLKRPPGVTGFVGWLCALAVCAFMAALALGGAVQMLIWFFTAIWDT